MGHPYMRDYCISPEMSYQFIMSPFMSKVMAAADFIQTDVTYGENKVLPYLFNATAFDEVTMNWVIVTRLRCNKENSEMYKKAFTLMFETRKSDEPSYDVHKNLQGIVVDWSDSERSGIIKALGSDLATKLLRGCAVHWARSYHISVLLHAIKFGFESSTSDFHDACNGRCLSHGQGSGHGISSVTRRN